MNREPSNLNPRTQPTVDPTIGGFYRAFGPLLSFLKKSAILLIVIFIGAVVGVLAPKLLLLPNGKPDPALTPWVVAAGIAAAVAVVMDRLADVYDKKIAAAKLRNAEDLAEYSVTDLNTFISEAIELAFLENTSRVTQLSALRRALVQCAAKSIGRGTRATYYTLRREKGGLRVLASPQHAAEYGRFDKPSRPFIERESPSLGIWRHLDEPDESREVVSAPQTVDGLDWSRKKYTTFYSVPVKAKNVTFGYLSVNNSSDGAIGGAQRATILAMARVFALAMALCDKPKALILRDASTDPHSFLEELTQIAPEDDALSTDSGELSTE